MKHDAEVGCNGKEGFMSGTAGMWSTCSRKAFLDHYNSMKSAGKWCLAGNSYLFFKDPSIIILTHLIVSHVAKSDACSQGLTVLTGHIDVGGSCPKNTYQYREIHCCCGDQSYEDGRSSEKSDETSGAQCCWNKCTWEVPPENCLKEVPNSQWVYHARFGYYIAMQNWKGDSIVGIHKNKFPWDITTYSCPENTKPYGDTCCCFHGCCWNKCVADNPPKECLPNIPGLEPVLEWAKNETKGYYTALQNWKGDLSEIKGFSEKESYEDGKNSSEKSDETSGSKETKKNYEDGKSSEESDETSETKRSYEDGRSSEKSDETSETKKSYEDGKSSAESDETSEIKKSYEDGKSSLKSDETSDDDRSSSKDVDKSDESSEEKGHL